MSEKEVKKEATKTRTVAAAAAKHENIMYVGPSIPGVVIQNTVYTKIPDVAEAAIKDCPAIRNLFVPIKEYSGAEIMIRNKSGYIFTAYELAAKYTLERRAK